MNIKDEILKYEYMMTIDETVDAAERFNENDILDLLHYIAQQK